MKKIELIKRFDKNNRTFGINEKALSDEEKEILVLFTGHVVYHNSPSDCYVLIKNIDRNGLVNRIAIRIENKKFLILFDDVYCGGLHGSDRVFEVLYQFEQLLIALTYGDNTYTYDFKHYVGYSLSNHIQYWEDIFYLRHIPLQNIEQEDDYL